MEIWRDIEGYEGLYQVSNYGKVKNVNTNKILKQFLTDKGYCKVSLSNCGNEKHLRVHRLVAEAFISNPDNLPQINHKDEDKTNNRVENLEWCDCKYNINYGTRLERISKRVLCIETGIIYNSINEAARQTGIFNSSICNVCNGKRKSAGKYHWEYV